MEESEQRNERVFVFLAETRDVALARTRRRAGMKKGGRKSRGRKRPGSSTSARTAGGSWAGDVRAVQRFSFGVVSRPPESIFPRFPSETGLVLGAPQKVTQILNNLISNAFKYSEPGVEIQTSVREFDFQQCNKYQIVVEDTGIGMSQAFGSICSNLAPARPISPPTPPPAPVWACPS